MNNSNNTAAKHTPGPWRVEDIKGAILNIVPQWQKTITRKALKGQTSDTYTQIANISKSFVVVKKAGKKIEFEHPPLPEGQAESNARLIAAAPELLESAIELESIVAAFVQDELSITTIDEAATLLVKLRAAIAKAQGGAK